MPYGLCCRFLLPLSTMPKPSPVPSAGAVVAASLARWVSSCRFPFLCALCPRPAAVFSGTSAAADVFLLGFPICSSKILKVSCGSLCVSAGNWCAIVSMVLALLYLQWYYTYIGRTNKDQITGHVSMFNVCFFELSI